MSDTVTVQPTAPLEEWRKPLREIGQDPFGEERSEILTKKHLETLLVSGDPEAAGIVQNAIESFAQELALVTRRFLKLKGWKDVERLIMGGGFTGSRVRELVIGRFSCRISRRGVHRRDAQLSEAQTRPPRSPRRRSDSLATLLRIAREKPAAG
jgi:hypothetical protein